MPDGLCARTPLTRARAVAVASPSCRGIEPRLGEPLGNDLLLVGTIGAPQRGAVDRRRGAPALRELPVAMLVLPARAARARRIAADRRLDHPAVVVAQRKRRLRDVERRAARTARAPVAGVDVGGVVVARERVEVLGDEVGQLRRRRPRAGSASASGSGSLPRGSRPAAARTAGRPPAYIRRSASSARSSEGGSPGAARRASQDAPSNDGRASGSGSASRHRSIAPGRLRSSLAVIASSARF